MSLNKTYIGNSDAIASFFESQPAPRNLAERFALWFVRKFTGLSAIRYVVSEGVHADFAAAERDFARLLRERGIVRAEDVHVLQVALNEDTGEIA